LEALGDSGIMSNIAKNYKNSNQKNQSKNFDFLEDSNKIKINNDSIVNPKEIFNSCINPPSPIGCKCLSIFYDL